MRDFEKSIETVAKIRDEYNNSIGKRIIVKGDPPFCNKSQYQKTVKYIGVIEACYPEFFVVRRDSGTRITYQYKDVYISKNSKHTGFLIL